MTTDPRTAQPIEGDPTMTQPDPTDLKTEVEQLQQANDATIQQLASQGIGVDTASLTALRLSTLAETLYGTADDPRYLAYEKTYQDRLAEWLGKAQAEINRAKLLAPGVTNFNGHH